MSVVSPLQGGPWTLTLRTNQAQVASINEKRAISCIIKSCWHAGKRAESGPSTFAMQRSLVNQHTSTPVCLWFPRHIHLARCMALGWVLWGHKYDVICVFPSLRLSPSIELVMLSLQFLLTCSKQLLKTGARIKRLCPLWFHLSTIWEKQWMDWEVGHLPAPSDSVSSHSLVATFYTNMSTLLHSKTKVYNYSIFISYLKLFILTLANVICFFPNSLFKISFLWIF